jgi:hypothetical protein
MGLALPILFPICSQTGNVSAEGVRLKELLAFTIDSCIGEKEGAYVASQHTTLEVNILAVGWDQAHLYGESHPPEEREDGMIGTV